MKKTILNVKLPWRSTESVAVIGSGSWATALVKIFTDSKIHVHWYVRHPEDVKYIQKNAKNPKYLTGVKFKRNRISVSDDVNGIIDKCKWIVLAVPSAFVAQVLQTIKTDLREKIIISGIKGILTETQQHIGPYMKHHFGLSSDQFVLLTGPSHAEEIALERTSYLTMVCENKEIANNLQKMIRASYIQSRYSDDVIGIEYASILKNVYAIASGMAYGLGYGDNFQSVLISNAMGEMKRFLNLVQPKDRDITQSAYLGDLLVTAYSAFSRNRRFGTLMGRGYTVRGVQMEMQMVAEGYYALKPLRKKAKEIQIEMPILNAVYDIVYQNKPIKKRFVALTKKLT